MISYRMVAESELAGRLIEEPLYIGSRDYQTVMNTADALRFGEIYINRTLGESVHAHHSGYGESGIGGEDGKWGLLRYTQIKTAYHHYGDD